ncbi:MAG: hypothetical protein JNJ73_21645 [Hyphomonadaceae bacterium]|nr:hypothetical protein [Hyphomonadaceae bacterium]
MNRYQIEFIDREGRVLLSRSGTLRELDAIGRRMSAQDDVAVFIRRLAAGARPVLGRSR